MSAPADRQQPEQEGPRCKHDVIFDVAERLRLRAEAAEAQAAGLRRAWNAGRVTLGAPDFLEWVAARCMRYEGLEPDGCVEVDYVTRLRAMAKAARAALTEKEERRGQPDDVFPYR